MGMRTSQRRRPPLQAFRVTRTGIALPAAAHGEGSPETVPFAIAGTEGFGIVSADGASRLITHWLLQSDLRAFLSSHSPTPDRETFLLRFGGMRLDATLERSFRAALFVNLAQNQVFLLEGWIEASLAPGVQLRAGHLRAGDVDARVTAAVVFWRGTQHVGRREEGRLLRRRRSAHLPLRLPDSGGDGARALVEASLSVTDERPIQRLGQLRIARLSKIACSAPFFATSIMQRASAAVSTLNPSVKRSTTQATGVKSAAPRGIFSPRRDGLITAGRKQKRFGFSLASSRSVRPLI